MADTLVDLYLRLSDGRDLSSLDARERKLRAEATRRGWTVRTVVIENDAPNGKRRNASAFKRRKVGIDEFGNPIMRVWRPGFRSILDALASRHTHALLAEDLDRAMRDPRDLEDLLDVVEAVRGTAASLSGSLSLTNGGTSDERSNARGRVHRAQDESADKARRVQAARERQADAAMWGGGRRPYGFTPVAHPDGEYRNTRLQIDPAEAAEIVKAADAVLAGTALKAIARDMRERGVPTVTGTKWGPETLRDVLMRALNAGIVVYQGVETNVRLPGDPILAEDVWRAVVSVLTNPDRLSGAGRAPCWLGTGLYRCVCGALMEIARGTGRAATYRCSHEGGTGDVHVRRNAEALDAFVAAVVVERLGRADAADLVTAPRADVDVDGLRSESKALAERKTALGRDYADGLIDRSTMLAGTTRIRNRQAEIDALLATTVVAGSPLSPLIDAEEPAAVWQAMALYDQRRAVAELATVTILPTVRRGRGFDPSTVDITWNR